MDEMGGAVVACVGIVVGVMTVGWIAAGRRGGSVRDLGAAVADVLRALRPW